MRKVIVDTDPGVDDAAALILLMAHKDVEIVGITIVHGNGNDVEMLGRNARLIVELCGQSQIPVYLGADRRLGATEPPEGAYFVHGDNALGGIALTEPKQGVNRDKCAVEFLIQACRAAPGEIEILALGPLTNVAAALGAAPALAQWCPRVTLMGGAFNHVGNITCVAEANVFNDPVAAQMVFSAGWRVLMCPLNVTHQTTMDHAFMRELKAASPKIGGFIHDISQFYLGFYHKTCGLDTMAVHDSSAVMAMLHPELFSTVVRTSVSVETNDGLTRGMTVADLRPWMLDETNPKHNVDVFLAVDATAFIDTFKRMILSLE